MTMITMLSIGLILGIATLGLFFGWIFRREFCRVVNIAVLTVGCAILAYGYSQWEGRRESEEVKAALYLREVVAGWALVGMGFLGLQLGREHKPSKPSRD